MPIDTSIYGNIRPVEMPSALDPQQKAMSLSSMAMQQQHLGKQMEAEDKDQKYADHVRKVSVVGNALESVVSAPDEAKQSIYSQKRQELVNAGLVDPKAIPEQYDPQLVGGFYRSFQQSKEYMDRELQKSHLAKNEKDLKLTDSQIAKNYADANRERLEKNPALMDPAMRLSKMGGEVKQKVGHIVSGLQSLSRYEDEFRKGGRQGYVTPDLPVVGKFVNSTPIDESRILMEEAIGRLASGGAINSGEEARFRKMIPTAADSDETAARKQINLRKEMEAKLIAYGLKPGELSAIGYDQSALGYGTESAAMDKRGLLPPREGGKGGLIRSAQAAPPAVRPGTEEQGYVFMGGDPADPKSWKRAR